jgi:hypothetical protein
MDDINQYVSKKVEGSVLATDPFPYLYINDIFPKPLYDHIESIFPTEEYLTTNNQKSYQTLDFTLKERKTLGIFNRLSGYSDLENYPYATECINLRRWFRDFLIPTIAKKLQVELPTCDDDTRFVLDLPGYLKRPHTDIPQKIFSILIYMSHSKCGTTILRPKQNGFSDSEGYDHKYAQFEEVFNPAFVPNALLAFPRTNTSFHCVNKLGEGEYRRAIHINIRL